MGLRRALRAAALCLVAPAAAAAATGPEACRSAARQVSAETGVPLAVLNAISLTETGRKRDGEVAPWPWTVNMEGAGHWFDSYGEALAYARSSHAQGKRSFDVGCFQINYRWHGQAFDSIEQMFDPVANARYAAEFLSRLYAETGDWSRAAGAYHSRTPEYANRYRRIFDRHYAALTDAPDAPVAASSTQLAAVESAEPMRQNGYPLLVADNGSGTMGSLVPIGQSSGGRFIPLKSAEALR